MKFNYDYWTNNKTMFQDAKLENKKILLWQEHLDKPISWFQQLPAWNEAEKIFIAGLESDFVNYVYEDSRIYVWDNVISSETPRYNHYFWWWHQTQEVEYYENNIHKLTNLLQNSPEKIFEFLIRTTNRAPQRIFIKDLILKNNLQNLILHNFDNGWLPGTDLELTDAHNSNECKILYNNMNQSANNASILPYRLYNNSWFSIVSESLGNKRFFTEKTAKAFLGKRLFVFIGAQYALRDLKSLGYKTFDGILDESYDCIENDHERWHNAFEQIQFICRCDPKSIYEKSLPILEHNQKTFLNQDWIQNAIVQMKQIAQR